MTAADPNGDEISYSITGSDGFTVDPATGQITVAEGTQRWTTKPSRSTP